MLGKEITIIGGSGGMGIVFSKYFKSHGFNVTLMARNEQKLKEVAENLEVNYELDLKKSVENADIVMVTIPIHSTIEMVLKVAPLMKKNAAITSELNWILMKTLSPDLSTRYKNVTELIKDLNKLERKKSDHTSEIKNIKNRIIARSKRSDHVCWNCHKAMPRKTKKCLYCGADQ